jgi:hypothetical protein
MERPLEIGSRRRCDNDGKLYTVKRPDHRFCRSKCRSEFHRFGSPYIQLRSQISKEVERIAEQMEYRLYTVLTADARMRYRQLWATRARRFDVLDQQRRDDAAAAAHYAGIEQ